MLYILLKKGFLVSFNLFFLLFVPAVMFFWGFFTVGF